MKKHRFQTRWQHTIAHAAVQLTADLQPHAVHCARGEFFRLGVSDRPGFFAASQGVAAAEHHIQRVLKVRFQTASVVTAFSRGQRHSRWQFDTRQRRLHMHTCHFVGLVRHKLNQQRFVIDQQCIGCGVVGPQRLAVKTARVLRRHAEHAAIEQDIALNAAYAKALHPAQQQPQLLHTETRVAAALQVKIALQHAIADLSVQVHRRAPSERRTEQIQRCAGGDQLHERRRVALHAGLVLQTRAARLHRQHDHAQRVRRQTRGFQGLLHSCGQNSSSFCPCLHTHCQQHGSQDPGFAKQACHTGIIKPARIIPVCNLS